MSWKNWMLIGNVCWERLWMNIGRWYIVCFKHEHRMAYPFSSRETNTYMLLNFTYIYNTHITGVYTYTIVLFIHAHTHVYIYINIGWWFCFMHCPIQNSRSFLRVTSCRARDAASLCMRPSVWPTAQAWLVGPGWASLNLKKIMDP